MIFDSTPFTILQEFLFTDAVNLFRKDIPMGIKHKMAISFGIIVLIFLGFQIVFGDRGLIDMNILKQGLVSMKERNNRLIYENIALYRTIERLNNDRTYIESIARQELGVIAPHEQILQLSKNRLN